NAVDQYDRLRREHLETAVLHESNPDFGIALHASEHVEELSSCQSDGLSHRSPPVDSPVDTPTPATHSQSSPKPPSAVVRGRASGRRGGALACLRRSGWQTARRGFCDRRGWFVVRWGSFF